MGEMRWACLSIPLNGFGTRATWLNLVKRNMSFNSIEWIPGERGRACPSKPGGSPFNSIEWIPDALPLSWALTSMNPFNSIEWIHAFNLPPFHVLRLQLSIPLNGFMVLEAVNSTYGYRFTFNSIEWIRGCTSTSRRLTPAGLLSIPLNGFRVSYLPSRNSNKACSIFQFHWMDSWSDKIIRESSDIPSFNSIEWIRC